MKRKLENSLFIEPIVLCLDVDETLWVFTDNQGQSRVKLSASAEISCSSFFNYQDDNGISSHCKPIAKVPMGKLLRRIIHLQSIAREMNLTLPLEIHFITRGLYSLKKLTDLLKEFFLDPNENELVFTLHNKLALLRVERQFEVGSIESKGRLMDELYPSWLEKFPGLTKTNCYLLDNSPSMCRGARERGFTALYYCTTTKGRPNEDTFTIQQQVTLDILNKRLDLIEENMANRNKAARTHWVVQGPN